MSKTSPAAAAPGKQRAPAIVLLDDRIPSMTDRELETLLANAERLAASGGDSVRATAERLMPLIIAEAETRTAAQVEAAQARRAESRKAKRETAGAPQSDGVNE
jgi:hypothetical protein